MKLHFPEITFQAAHYIPGHDHCGSPHGHTYFVRELTVDLPQAKLNEQGISVDFGIIKGYFKESWDHKNIIPKASLIAWQDFYSFMGYKDNLRPVISTSAEFMAQVMKKELEGLILKEAFQTNVVHFELCEGPAQGVFV